MGVEGDVDSRINCRQPLVRRQASISCKTPAKTTLPGMACNQTPQSCRNGECFEDNGAGSVVKCFVEELKNRNPRGRGGDICKIADYGEEHGHGKKPARDETNGDGPHDGNWNHPFRAVHFFGEMGGAIEACKTPVGVDETDDEGDAALLPAGVVDEGCEDKFGILVGGCGGRNGDEDHGERKQGCPQGHVRNGGQSLAVTVEDETEGIGKLVCKEDMPSLGSAAYRLTSIQYVLLYI